MTTYRNGVVLNGEVNDRAVDGRHRLRRELLRHVLLDVLEFPGPVGTSATRSPPQHGTKEEPRERVARRRRRRRKRGTPANTTRTSSSDQ